jgi:Cof subfamily protein (haloacid dehalogenase superfamily)
MELIPLLDSPIKALFLDIDGTLINPDHILPESTIQTVKKLLKQYKTQVFLISARPPSGIKPFYEQLGLDTPFCAYNGSIIGDYKNSAKEYNTHRELVIEAEIIPEILQEAKNHNFTVCVYKGNTLFINDLQNPYAVKEHTLTFCDLSLFDLPELMKSWTDKNTGPNKIQCLGEEIVLREFVKKMEEEYSPKLIQISKSSLLSYEITQTLATKNESVEYLMNQYQVPLTQVMAIGDNFNDLATLKMVGYGVAMGNAPEEVRNKVKYTTKTNSEDGVSKAILDFFPNIN